MKKKLIIIIPIILILLGVCCYFIFGNKNESSNPKPNNDTPIVDEDEEEFSTEDENPIVINIPVSFKYNDVDKKLYLYMNNKLIEYDEKNYPKSFDGFKNVSMNNIIYNVRYDKKNTLDAVTVNGDYVMEVTKLINSSFSYSGNFTFDNNTINLYYINNNVCSSNSSEIIGKIYQIRTVKDKFTLLKEENDLIKSDYINVFPSAC